MDRLFATKEEYLADLERRRLAMLPLLEDIDWTGCTRPPRDPAERAFFGRMEITTRSTETTELPPRSEP